MSEKQEAFSDIIEKMRRDGIVHDSIPTRYLNDYAARLEAAYKRELAAYEQTMGKLREALEHIVNERGILDFCHNNLGSKTWEGWDKVYKTLRKWIDEAMAALAAPARNCDAGTAQE